jgi:nucleotide-binding universal stress UspA family protein
MTPTKPLKWERVLVPTDFSRFANSAVGYAHALAEKFGAELHVLYVVKDYSEAIAEHALTGVLGPGAEQDEFDRWLAGLLGEPGTVRRVTAVRVGDDVAATVAKYCDRHGIDLIVLATHGRTGLKHLLFGSIAEKVLRTAPCPVLSLRT